MKTAEKATWTDKGITGLMVGMLVQFVVTWWNNTGFSAGPMNGVSYEAIAAAVLAALFGNKIPAWAGYLKDLLLGLIRGTKAEETKETVPVSDGQSGFKAAGAIVAKECPKRLVELRSIAAEVGGIVWASDIPEPKNDADK